VIYIFKKNLNGSNNLIESNFTNRLIKLLFVIYIILSFYEGYIIKIVGPISRYYILFFMIMLLIYFKSIEMKIEHFIIVLWFSWKLGSIFWAMGITDFNFNIIRSHIFTHIGMIALFVVLTSVNFKFIFINKILDYFLYISFSLAFFGIFFSNSYRGNATSRQVLSILGTEMDPNNLAALYLMGIAISVYYLIINNFKEKKYIVILVLNSAALFLTASRAGFLTLLLILTILVIYTIINNTTPKIIKMIFIILIFISLVYYLSIHIIPEESLERIFSIQGYTGEGGSGSIRLRLWSKARDMFLVKPFFGWGWGGHNLGLHNTFITLLIDTGIIGFILFIILFFILYFKSSSDNKLLITLILISSMVPSFFIDAINKRFFWNGIILSFMIVNSIESDRKDIKICDYLL